MTDVPAIARDTDLTFPDWSDKEAPLSVEVPDGLRRAIKFWAAMRGTFMNREVREVLEARYRQARWPDDVVDKVLEQILRDHEAGHPLPAAVEAFATSDPTAPDRTPAPAVVALEGRVERASSLVRQVTNLVEGPAVQVWKRVQAAASTLLR